MSNEIEIYGIVLWQLLTFVSYYRYSQARSGWLPMDRHISVHVDVDEGPFAVSDCSSDHLGPDWIPKRVSRSYSLQSAECGSLGFVGPH